VFTAIDVNNNVNLAGFNNDAVGYHMLFERNDPGIAGNELFLGTFLTLNDLINNNLFNSVFTAIDVNDNFNVAGMAATRDVEITPVPEPTTLALILLGLSVIGARRWLRSGPVLSKN
jgi:hypothetical protein